MLSNFSLSLIKPETYEMLKKEKKPILPLPPRFFRLVR